MFDETHNYSEVEVKEQLRKTRIADIESASDEHHVDIRNEHELIKYIDKPWQSTSRILFEKNIQTYMSTANKNNLKQGKGTASLSILRDSLSEENKRIAEDLRERGAVSLVDGNELVAARVMVELDIDGQSTRGEVEDLGEKVAGQFIKQRLKPTVYGPLFVVQNFTGLPDGISTELENLDGQFFLDHRDFFARYGYFFDPRVGVFFESEEDMRRAWEPVDKKEFNAEPEFLKVIE